MTTSDYEIELRISRLREKQRRRKLLRSLIIWGLVIWFLVDILFGVSFVEGNSMRPSFRPGDLVIYWRRPWTELTYNDVVILNTKMNRKAIKRIVAVPGDVIDVDEYGHLTRNGEAVSEPEMLFGKQEQEYSVEFPYTVPEGMYFYLGDNRQVSLDSRYLGAINKGDILGIVIGNLRIGGWGNKSG